MKKMISAFPAVPVPLAFTILILPGLHSHAGILFFEGFETDGLGTRYTVTGNFTDGADDYFTRTDGSTEATGIPEYTGFTGSYFWAAEDIDASENPTGQAIIEFSSISLSDFPEIRISLDIAAGSTTAFDSVDDFVLVQFRVDNGAWTTALAFQNDGEVFNSSLLVDTDLDGIGDGTLLGLEMQTISSSAIPVAGSYVDVRIDTLMTSGSEAVAFDNIQVVGVPEPNVVALIFGMASLALIAWKRLLLIREENKRA